MSDDARCTEESHAARLDKGRCCPKCNGTCPTHLTPLPCRSVCLAHFLHEPCPTCGAYIAAGL